LFRLRTCLSLSPLRRHLRAFPTRRSSDLQVINALRNAIGTLPVKPLRADIAPASVFSQWMQNSESLPAELRLGDRCELKGSKDASATVRFSAVDITQEEILAHLERSEEHTSALQSRFDLV